MVVKSKYHKPITKQNFDNAISEVLLSKPIKKESYENRRPIKQD